MSMNEKRLLSFILAVLIAAFTLTACCGGEPSDPSVTTDPSMALPQKNPLNTAEGFAERLKNALDETRVFTDFEVREKHTYSPASIMERGMVAKWQSDFSDAENPKFLYTAQRNPNAESPELLLFYDDGFFYVKDRNAQYRQPADLGYAKGNIPCDGLTALLGDKWSEAFSDAVITEHGDGTVTATVILSLFDEAETITEYLKLFGIEASAHPYGMDGDHCEIIISVSMNGERLLSYTIETTMSGFDVHREMYPVTYTVKAVCHNISNEFSPILPDEDARAGYIEAEPEISDITAEEFLRRFAKSDEVSGNAVYTEMITNSSVTYEFSEGYQVTIPILTVTAIDLSKPRAPKIAVVETKTDAMGLVRKKEVYYKDDMYYYAENGNKVALSYPAEEYLANAAAIAKEKAEAGITTFFLSAQMLEQAVFTIGPDQSVSAFMEFDGNSQQKNIFYQINSIYNDDLYEMQNVSIRKTTLAVTLDRFNHMTSYTLTVTASIELNGVQALATYAIQYHLNYSETPREIDFPDDLESWGKLSEDI